MPDPTAASKNGEGRAWHALRPAEPEFTGTTMPDRPYTPAQLAEHWQCSERHVRNMIVAGRARGFPFRANVAYPCSGGQGEGGAMPEVRLVRYRGVWAAAWQEGGRTKRRSLRTSDRAVAEQALADWKRAAARKATTTGEIMALYLAEKDKTAAAPARLREAWKPLAPIFANLRPDQIGREQCRAYVALRQRQGRRRRHDRQGAWYAARWLALGGPAHAGGDRAAEPAAATRALPDARGSQAADRQRRARRTSNCSSCWP